MTPEPAATPPSLKALAEGEPTASTSVWWGLWNVGGSIVGRLLLALVAGCLMAGAFPAFNWWWLAPVGLGLLCAAATGLPWRLRLVVGLLWGVGFFGIHLHWAGVYVGAVSWALVGLQACFLPLFALALGWLEKLPAVGYVVGVGCWWALVEMLRSTIPFGGFAWGRVAFSQADSWLLGWVSVLGVPGLGALLASLAATLWLLSKAIWIRRWRTVAMLSCLVLGLAVAGSLIPAPTDAQSGELNVAAIQGNVPRLGLDFNAQRRAVLDNHVSATKQLAQEVKAGQRPSPDLVVWPENASDIDPLVNADAREQITQASTAVGVPILVGTLLTGDGQVRNATVAWLPQTGPGPQYVKRHPVPFGEYIPYRSFFRKFNEKVDLVRADMVAGDQIGLFDLAQTRWGDLICFEIVEDDLVRDVVQAGAEVVVLQTNNATFGFTDESAQQLAMSRVRAREYGRSVVHISTVGLSGLILPDGHLRTQSEHFTQSILSATLPKRTTRTLADRWGETMEWILVGFALALGCAGAVLGHRRSTRQSAATTPSTQGQCEGTS